MKTLFETLTLKNLTIKNRICVPPMVCFNWSDESGIVSDKHVAHYRAVAQGGPGLIIQEATCIDPVGRLANSQLGIWCDEQIPGLKRIVDAVHEEGVPILVQIHHAGIMGLTNPAPCPSAYEFERRDFVQKGAEMTLEEIAELRRNFAEAARRAQKAGYDGVELHGCHSYLLCQFLNSRVNKRTDKYADGMVLVEEVLQDVREATGPDFIVGIRLGIFEPGLADGIAHAKRLAELGIDFLDLSYGFGPESDCEKPEDFPMADVMGVDYLGLIAYYLASPLNLFSVLVPESLVLEYFSLLIGTGAAGAGLDRCGHDRCGPRRTGELRLGQGCEGRPRYRQVPVLPHLYVESGCGKVCRPQIAAQSASEISGGSKRWRV